MVQLSLCMCPPPIILKLATKGHQIEPHYHFTCALFFIVLLLWLEHVSYYRVVKTECDSATNLAVKAEIS